MEMELTIFNQKRNTLHVLTEAILPKNLHGKELRDYMSKPYSERIAESPYREQIEEEIKKYPNCIISEYTNCD